MSKQTNKKTAGVFGTDGTVDLNLLLSFYFFCTDFIKKLNHEFAS